MSCLPCVTTNQGTVKIMERFGAFTRIARPGLSCVVPCIDCVSGTVSMRLQQMEVRCETKTKDNGEARKIPPTSLPTHRRDGTRSGVRRLGVRIPPAAE